MEPSSSRIRDHKWKIPAQNGPKKWAHVTINFFTNSFVGDANGALSTVSNELNTVNSVIDTGFSSALNQTEALIRNIGNTIANEANSLVPGADTIGRSVVSTVNAVGNGAAGTYNTVKDDATSVRHSLFG